MQTNKMEDGSMNDETGVAVGVIGVGSMGQHHARVYHSLSDVELKGVYDADDDRAIEVAGRYGTEPRDIDELLGLVDTVSIAFRHCQRRPVTNILAMIETVSKARINRDDLRGLLDEQPRQNHPAPRRSKQDIRQSIYGPHPIPAGTWSALELSTRHRT